MPTIDINGCATAFSETGNGEPVLLLHGTGGSGGHWQGLADRLGVGFHLLAPDRWGYGESAAWHGGEPFSLAAEAELARASARRRGRPLHLVGNSSGGAVARSLVRGDYPTGLGCPSSIADQGRQGTQGRRTKPRAVHGTGSSP
jgi:pimeloyl-ACP methyl ester carboxylesterase